jgi:hypothetical protein
LKVGVASIDRVKPERALEAASSGGHERVMSMLKAKITAMHFRQQCTSGGIDSQRKYEEMEVIRQQYS